MRRDGTFICGKCGDPLLEKKIKLKQIFGLIIVSIFISPILFMIAFIIKDFTKEHYPNNTVNTSLINLPLN